MKYAKKTIALALVLFPVLVAAQLPNGQHIVAHVPFEFTIANKVVPAGECIVQRVDISNQVLLIRNRDAKVGAMTTTLPASSKKASSSYALVFHKYGNEYFLAGVKIAGSRAMYQLPSSKAEAELLAQNATPTEEVLLASLQ